MLSLKKIILGILIFSGVNTVYACEVRDDSNHIVNLTKPAARIISLAPDLTELLFAAGAGNQVVGVASGSDYPPAAKKLPVAASYNSLNAEAILALHPDLIVAWAGGSSDAVMQSLQNFGIPVFFSHQKNISDIPVTLQKLGCLAGTQQIANQAALNFSARVHALQQKYSGKKPISVFYMLSEHPLMTVNKDSWITQIISMCGGQNIFANAKGIAPQINLEAVLAANPDVILTSDTNRSWKKEWNTWPQLFAVKNKFLYSIDPDLLERAGPRLIDGAEQICDDLDHSVVH
jgi:iron complex transport system substrate-binding protein